MYLFFFLGQLFDAPTHVLELNVALKKLELGVLPFCYYYPSFAPGFRVPRRYLQAGMYSGIHGRSLYRDKKNSGMKPSNHTLTEKKKKYYCQSGRKIIY